MSTGTGIGALGAASAIKYRNFRGGLFLKYLMADAAPRGRILVDVDAFLGCPFLATLMGFAAHGVWC